MKKESQIKRYTKRSFDVSAIQWNGGDYEILNEFCGRNWSRADAVDEAGPDDKENVVVWNVKEKQYLNVPIGHWIIQGIDGELYPCDPKVFARTYDISPNQKPL